MMKRNMEGEEDGSKTRKGRKRHKRRLRTLMQTLMEMQGRRKQRKTRKKGKRQKGLITCEIFMLLVTNIRTIASTTFMKSLYSFPSSTRQLLRG